MASNKILTIHGESTTGTKHSLEFDPTPGQRVPVSGFKVTILGPNGKRHASAKVSNADAKQLIRYLTEQLERNDH